MGHVYVKKAHYSVFFKRTIPVYFNAYLMDRFACTRRTMYTGRVVHVYNATHYSDAATTAHTIVCVCRMHDLVTYIRRRAGCCGGGRSRVLSHVTGDMSRDIDIGPRSIRTCGEALSHVIRQRVVGRNVTYL